MANGYQDLMEQQDLFVDESGLTSMEPEGTDPHHHHMGAWHSAATMAHYQQWEGRDRWEGSMEIEAVPERGQKPAEGDGEGGLE